MRKLQRPASKDVWWIQFGRGERELYHHQGKLPEVSGNIKEVLEFKFGQDFKRKDKV